MCFYYDDYDWTADVFEESERVAEQSLTCVECGKGIAAGETHIRIFAQESEECLVCEWEEADEPCEEHDYGETYTARRCQSCERILKAVQSVEVEEGCPPHATRPAIGELDQAFYDHANAETYANRVIEMYPTLADHRWVKHVLEPEEVLDDG